MLWKKSLRKKNHREPIRFTHNVRFTVYLAFFVSGFTDAVSIFSYQVQIPISFTKLISIGDLNKYLIFERKNIIHIGPVRTYFLHLSLLLTRHHNRRQIHGITRSILGVWVASKYHLPLPTCIWWILHSWNGDNFWFTRHNMQFIPYNMCSYSLPGFITDIQYMPLLPSYREKLYQPSIMYCW